ncbi:hypothetical protein KIW84_052419 [Lathyrus oleraceus]|uniref:Uncharacterized protein n=1 Tax=Pisum sativum TaxID=3888 RepID=A0A9D4WPW3_PEA|nr:hypothetical protein KIW84_052419 [Pisum sativum]
MGAFDTRLFICFKIHTSYTFSPRMIGTNYVGAFVLTKLLLPLLENSPVSSKIVNVTSFTHRAVTNLQVDEGTVSGKKFLSSKHYPYAQVYEYSKRKRHILDELVQATLYL